MARFYGDDVYIPEIVEYVEVKWELPAEVKWELPND